MSSPEMGQVGQLKNKSVNIQMLSHKGQTEIHKRVLFIEYWLHKLYTEQNIIQL